MNPQYLCGKVLRTRTRLVEGVRPRAPPLVYMCVCVAAQVGVWGRGRDSERPVSETGERG